MNAILVHFASGQAFFSGCALIGLALWLGSRDTRRTAILAGIACLVGAVFVVLSTTPLPLWFYLPAGAATFAWFSLFRRPGIPLARRRQLAILVALIWLAGVGLELPYHIEPTIPPAGDSRHLTIFGDSVTAGLGDEEITWPRILAGETGWIIHDNSFPGATTKTALKRIRTAEIPPGLVLIELGGNDIFGSGDAEAFSRNLDEILLLAAQPGRVVLMLELPLPPLQHRFGASQRRLARKHGVHLIPKRVFLSVLLSDETTLDSIHLSPAGHRRMAERMRNLLPAPPGKETLTNSDE